MENKFSSLFQGKITTTRKINKSFFFILFFQIHNSTDSVVILQSVNLSTTGRYRCEVSAEAPSFQTVSDHGDMIVVGKYRYNNKIFT